jgi:outer membrane lipoprotein-sorting protein
MAAQPEQTGLPELVALVYRADWTQLRLSGTVHARHDVALRNRMSQVQATGGPLPGLFGRWLRSAQPGQTQPGQTQPGQPQPGPDSQPDAVTRGRVLLANGGRYRLELAVPDEDRGAADGGPRLTVCDGESQWEVGADAATREEAHDPPYPLADLLIPSRLLTEFDLELAGTAAVGGRVAYRVMITPRAALSGRGAIRGRHPDRVSALVDAELGILLSYEEIFDGRQLKFAELTDLLLDPPAAAGPGQFLPPPGMPVRDSQRPGERIGGRGHALPGVAAQAARLVAWPAAAAIGFAARHLGQDSPGPSTQAADEAGIPVAPRATDRAQLTPLTDDLVNLLYRTGLPPPAFTATAHERTDGAGLKRMGAALRASLPPAIDGIFGPDQLWSAFGEQFPERIYQISRLTVAMPGRYRIDHLADGQPTKPQTIACDGERLWKVYPNRVATGPAQPLYLDFGRLADQSCLLYGCELAAAGEVEVDGRRGFLVVADGVDGVDGKWPGDLFPMTDHVEVVVDAQLGIALRETSYFQGEPFHCIELRDVSAQVDHGAFRIDIPAGTRTVGTGLLSDLDTPTPVKVARLAAGLGVAGVVALTGWLQKRPAGQQPPPRQPPPGDS